MVSSSVEATFSQNRLIEESNARGNQAINCASYSEHPKARRRQCLRKSETNTRFAILNNLAIVLEQARFGRFAYEQQ